jgi:hypothetical protein
MTEAEIEEECLALVMAEKKDKLPLSTEPMCDTRPSLDRPAALSYQTLK